MSCLSSARYGFLLASLTATALPAAPLSPADQNAIEQQQKALLEQAQQQRDLLRHSTPDPSLPEAPHRRTDRSVFCTAAYPTRERHGSPTICAAKIGNSDIKAASKTSLNRFEVKFR